MTTRVETLTPPNTPTPIGRDNHVAKVGQHIWIGGTAGVDPATGQLAGPDVAAQTRQILASFRIMLEAVGSDLDHVVHINIFLKTMTDFEAMNTAYAEVMGAHRPARTVVAVSELPKAQRAADDEPDGGHTDVEAGKEGPADRGRGGARSGVEPSGRVLRLFTQPTTASCAGGYRPPSGVGCQFFGRMVIRRQRVAVTTSVVLSSGRVTRQ